MFFILKLNSVLENVKKKTNIMGSRYSWRIGFIKIEDNKKNIIKKKLISLSFANNKIIKKEKIKIIDIINFCKKIFLKKKVAIL